MDLEFLSFCAAGQSQKALAAQLLNYQYTLAAYVFVPSVIGENILTPEFGMIKAETACWDKERK